MLLHAMQELDNDLRAWPNQHLSFPALLSVVDGIERIIEDACFDHVLGSEILNSIRGEVSAGCRGSR